MNTKPPSMIEHFRAHERLEHTGKVFEDFYLKIEYISLKKSKIFPHLSFVARE